MSAHRMEFASVRSMTVRIIYGNSTTGQLLYMSQLYSIWKLIALPDLPVHSVGTYWDGLMAIYKGSLL